MQEHGTMELFKWYIATFFMVAGLVLFVFFSQISDTNRFQSYVDSQIERYAGLTPQSIANIELYSESNFGGRYSVASADMGIEKEYGDVVDYEVRATYRLAFDVFNLGNEPRSRSTKGQARVLVRGKSGSTSQLNMDNLVRYNPDDPNKNVFVRALDNGGNVSQLSLTDGYNDGFGVSLTRDSIVSNTRFGLSPVTKGTSGNNQIHKPQRGRYIFYGAWVRFSEDFVPVAQGSKSSNTLHLRDDYSSTSAAHHFSDSIRALWDEQHPRGEWVYMYGVAYLKTDAEILKEYPDRNRDFLSVSLASNGTGTIEMSRPMVIYLEDGQNYKQHSRVMTLSEYN